MTLTLLGALVLLTGYSFLVNVHRGYTPSTPYSDPFLYTLLFCGCAAAIALQYATRRAWLSRTLLIVFLFLIAITVSVYRSQSMVDRAYPQPSSASTPPVSASFTPEPHSPVVARSWEGEDYIDLHIRYSGVAEGYAVFANDFKFSLTAADGSQWTSPWQQLYEHILPGDHPAFLSPMMSPAIYDRFKSAPVTLSITFAVTRYQSDTVTNMAFPSHDVPIPGIGFCTPGSNFSENFVSANSPNLSCRSALRQPRLTHATALWSSVPCFDPSPASPNATVQSDAWIEPDDVDFAMTSVRSPGIWFMRRTGDEPDTRHSHWHLCPGAPLTLTRYHLVDRIQTTLTIPNFQIPTNLIQTGN